MCAKTTYISILTIAYIIKKASLQPTANRAKRYEKGRL